MMIKHYSRIWFVESGDLKDVYESSVEVSMEDAVVALIRRTNPEMLGLVVMAHTEIFPSDLEINDIELFEEEVSFMYVPHLIDIEE